MTNTKPVSTPTPTPKQEGVTMTYRKYTRNIVVPARTRHRSARPADDIDRALFSLVRDPDWLRERLDALEEREDMSRPFFFVGGNDRATLMPGDTSLVQHHPWDVVLHVDLDPYFAPIDSPTDEQTPAVKDVYASAAKLGFLWTEDKSAAAEQRRGYVLSVGSSVSEEKGNPAYVVKGVLTLTEWMRAIEEYDGVYKRIEEAGYVFNGKSLENTAQIIFDGYLEEPYRYYATPRYHAALRCALRAVCSLAIMSNKQTPACILPDNTRLRRSSYVAASILSRNPLKVDVETVVTLQKQDGAWYLRHVMPADVYKQAAARAARYGGVR